MVNPVANPDGLLNWRRCRACHAEIGFLARPGARSIPVNRRPRLLIVGQGNDRGFDVRTHQALRGVFIEPGREEETIGRLRDEQRGAVICHVWITHFATCTAPERFRRDRPKSAHARNRSLRPGHNGRGCGHWPALPQEAKGVRMN